MSALVPRILSVFSPPPEDKTPGNMIYAWGIEMLRAGFELAIELLDGSTETTD